MCMSVWLHVCMLELQSIFDQSSQYKLELAAFEIVLR